MAIWRGQAASATLAALCLLLTACGGERTRPGTAAPYRLAGPACQQALEERGLAVASWRRSTSRGCPVETPVRAAAARTTSFQPSLETSCAMLVAWSDFEQALQAAAEAQLGQKVTSIRHYGSYACRRMTGKAGRPSLHAQARALDIAAFRLADGSEITVADGWSGPRRQRRFLRAVAQAACRHFSVTLTPASDAAHRDHLHVDIGPWRWCGL